MRFAYSTNAYTRVSVTEAVADVAKLGYEGVEILADVPHAFPGRVDLEKLSRALTIPISNLNGNTNLGLDDEGRDADGFWPGFLDPDPEARGMRITYVKRVVDLARTLGAENVCAASGRLPEGTTEARGWELAVAGIREIMQHAEKEPSVRVGIEAEPGFFIQDAAALKRLLDEVNHPLLGLNLDVGHAVCVGDDPAEMAETFRGRIWNFHLEDIKGKVHDHLIPGEGDIDFARLRDALKKTGYDRFLTLELYPYKKNPGEAGRKGLEYLKGIFDA